MGDPFMNYIAAWLRELGVAVIDLDAVAREIRNNGTGPGTTGRQGSP